MSATAAIQERAPEAQREKEKGSRLTTALAVAGSMAALMGGAAEMAGAAGNGQHNRSAKHGKGKAPNAKPKVRVRNYPDGSSIKVVKLRSKSVGFSNKLERCFADGRKREQPAPPVDPYANCRGDVSVKVVARAVAFCRRGWMGGRAAARASVRQNVHVRAWSRAVASGRAQARARTRISDRVTTRARASVDCFKLTPGQTPQIPTTPNIPTTPDQPDQNRPPTGVMTPPQHRFPNSEGPVCVDGISDPDGDAVTAKNFDFENTNGQDVGKVLGGVFTMPGSNGETQCVRWRAPGEPMQVTASADLSDGRGGQTQVMDNFPVIPNQQ